MRRSALFAIGLAVGLNLLVSAQQVGPNVNVMSGKDPNTGDAFLQRQNEPAAAVSTRNPDHLMFAFNDYRTVDIALDVTEPDAAVFARATQKKTPGGALTREAVRAQTPAEAWIGLAFSRDRGRTFYTALLPGYPQDQSLVGRSSPVYGDNAGTDPVLITGQNGRVYLIALTFDRGGMSRISSTRFTDRNNVEGGEPFYFDFTRQIDHGSMASKGRFGDKPSGAAFAGSSGGVFSTSGVSKKKKQIVVVPGCERVYTAYTVFEGNDASGNFRSSIYTAASASCGDSWSNAVKVSGPYSVNGVNYPGTRNQGTATTVDPDTGDVYITWRTYGPDGMVYVKSNDGGLTFSSPKSIATSAVYPFDQQLLKTTSGDNAVTFRSNAYPSVTTYDGKLMAVWSERVDLATGLPAANGWPRAVVTVGTPGIDGSVAWTQRRAVDLTDPGVAANTRCEQAIPSAPPGPPPPVPPTPQTYCRATGAQVMPYVVANDSQIAVVYYEARSDAQAPGGIAPGTGFISGIQRQVDVRAALLGPPPANPTSNDIATWTTATSFQLSRYQIDSRTGRIKENPNAPRPELAPRVNFANYPMYLGGLAPFIGDYLHAVPIRPDGSGPGYRVAFTSNELVDPPPLGANGLPDFTKYNKPQSGLLSSCNPGSRNSTIMTAEVGTGLVVGSPRPNKQLLNTQGQPVQRAFAVYVENHTPAYRAFHLTFGPLPSGIVASFEQFSTVASVDVEVLASSSVTRTVFLTATSPAASGAVVVNAEELQLPNPPGLSAATSLNLKASVTLNGDPTNPPVGFAANGGNPGLENTETHSPQLGTPQLGTPQLGTPQLGTPHVGSPQLGTPQLGTPQLGTPQLGTPQLSTPQLGTTGPTDPYITDVTVDITNTGNTASAFNSLVSLSNAPHLQTTGHTFQVIVYRVHQTAAANGCNVGMAQQDQVVYMTPQLGTPQLGTPQLGTTAIGAPQLGTPQLGTPQLGTPQLGTPQLGTPQLATASFTIAPADPTPLDHDGSIHQHQAHDRLRMAVRIRHPATEHHVVVNNVDYLSEHPDPVTEFTKAFALSVQAQAANTNDSDGEPDGTFVDSLAPETTILTGPPANTSNPSAAFTFAGTDNLSTPSKLVFECSLDGGAFAACPGSATFTVLPGAHSLSVRAKDEAGNLDATPETRAWTVDVQPPDTTIVSGPTGSSGPNTLFGFGGTDNVTTPAALTFECSLDAGAFAACPASAPYNGLSAGPHTLNVRATDLAGNVDPTPASRTWTVDNTPPDTTIVSGPTGGSGPNVLFGFGGTDDLTAPAALTFECSMDGGVFAGCPASTPYNGLAPGSHTLDVRAIDLAGNVDPSPASRTWTVDNTPPDTSILSGPFANTLNTSAPFTFAGTDNFSTPANLTFECSLDGGAYAACPAATTFTVPAGPHSLSVRARDEAGNVDASPATRSWTVLVPSMSIDSATPPTAAAGFGQLITLSTTGSPAGTPTAFFTQGTTFAQGFVFESPSTQGTYYVRLPFPADGVDATNDGLAAGAATVRLLFTGNLTSNELPITVSTTPGTPVARFMYRLVNPPSGGDSCGTAFASQTPVTSAYAGDGLAISAYGTDTTQATAIFTQGANTFTAQSTCSNSGPSLGLAATFVIPAGLTPGSATVQVRTRVNGVDSLASNSLTLTILEPISFKPGSDVTVGNSPVGIASGDLNGDGKLDAVTANSATNDFSVLFGNGFGGFGAATNYFTGGARSVELGDLNGDGKLDVVVAMLGGGVSVALNQGNGTFATPLTVPSAGQPNRVAIADVNSDGNGDMIVAKNGATSTNNVGVLLGNGNGTFQTEVLFSAGTFAWDVEVGDLNGDGKRDLVVSNRDSLDVSVLLGNGSGGFGAATSFPASPSANLFDLALADLNQDGKLDVVVGSNTNAIYLLFGNGSGGFGTATTIGSLSFGRPLSMAVSDFNGDGTKDLAIANFDPGASGHTVSILRGTGLGYFAAPVEIITGTTSPEGSPSAIAVGDFDNDGTIDFVFTRKLGTAMGIRRNTTPQ